MANRSRSPITRLAFLTAAVMALSLAVAPTVAAHGRDHDGGKKWPTTIDLPAGFMPEGIESRGRTLYTGSLAGGAIWKVDARTGKGRQLVAAVDGKAATGLHIDRRGRLWVAGADGQEIRVYSLRSGALLRTYAFPTAGFINDLDIVGNTVYATDSVNPQLLVIKLGKRGKLPPADAGTTRALTGDLVYTTGFNANGVVARGRHLIVVQSNTGLLFRVNPKTGDTTAIDTGGYLVTNGDGLELHGRHLYVVRNRDEIVAKLRLSTWSTRARLVGEITSPDLDVPTTATIAKGRLYVVNARFGTTDPQPADYWITRLPTRP